ITAADDAHQRERAVLGVVGRVHPDPARLSRLEHRAVHRRVGGGRRREPGAVEVAGCEDPAGHGEPAGIGPPLHGVMQLRCDDVDLRPGVEQGFDLADRDPPSADHHAPAAGDEQVHRVPTESGAPDASELRHRLHPFWLGLRHGLRVPASGSVASVNVVFALAAVATALSSMFALATAKRAAEGRGPHQLSWAISLACFAAASAALALGASTGWDPGTYRIFYLGG